MFKKLLLALGALLAVLTGVSLMSAFEAHIVNVTAHIENALDVFPEEIDFGTVFPQEYLERELTVKLSDSFVDEERVDDVRYVIKQKPKCVNEQGEYAPIDYAAHECPEGYEPMLSLCPYLSKMDGDEEDANDIGIPSYYVKDEEGDFCQEPLLDHAIGYLSKLAQDTTDTWIVDLKVPPVSGYIAQDWPAGCPVLAENNQDYGCDLWIEVVDISTLYLDCEDLEGETGWYGKYYNYLSSHADMELDNSQWPDDGHGDPLSADTAWDTDWYNGPYYRFDRIDNTLTFGNDFFPFDTAKEEETNGHEYHFGAHWQAKVTAPSAGDYAYTLTTDDDAWVYLDGALVIDNSGIHAAVTKQGALALTGEHIVDVFFAERHTILSHMSFSIDGVELVPYREDCEE